MLKAIFKVVSKLVFIGVIASLIGCAGSVVNMKEVPADQAVIKPVADKAKVVFMRPASLGWAIQSSVFEIVNEKPELVGIVAAKKKAAYTVDPGNHTFMVVGESADFMSAELEAGKIYYALVTPRMGFWKARFSLAAVSEGTHQSEQFKEWDNECKLVETIDSSYQWANSNMADLQQKYEEYYAVWMKKDEMDRPKLELNDGI